MDEKSISGRKADKFISQRTNEKRANCALIV